MRPDRDIVASIGRIAQRWLDRLTRRIYYSPGAAMVQLSHVSHENPLQIDGKDVRRRNIFISSSSTKCFICPAASASKGDFISLVGHEPCKGQRCLRIRRTVNLHQYHIQDRSQQCSFPVFVSHGCLIKR